MSLLPEAARTEEITNETLAVFVLWFHAVAQHYGPGTDYVDVTTSLEVAIWFGLNQSTKIKSMGIIGPPGPPDPRNDHPKEAELIGYEPVEKGLLYVFDLPKWNGKIMVEAGTIVDLADAPALFSSSPRMRAQRGCLVYCRNSEGGYLDLKPKCVGGSPLVIGRPMTGASGLDRQVAGLFPSPDQDEWYARFLSVPMNYAPRPSPPTLRRSIPVTVYYDGNNTQYMQEVLFRDVCIEPPLLNRLFREFQEPADRPDSQALLHKAVSIQLEAPLIFPYPPGDSDMWHHGLLATDVPRQCLAYDFESDTPCATIPLDNVLFEFNMMEQVGWDRIVKDNLPIRLLRGVWLRQIDGEFAVSLVIQDVPGTGPVASAFLPFRYDPKTNQFIGTLGPNHPPLLLREAPEIAKPTFIALMLLGYLSQVAKADASVRTQFTIKDEAGKPTHKYMVACTQAAARLLRVASPYGDWYVIRNSVKLEEPFTMVSHGIGVVELESSEAFREIPLATIQSQVRALVSRK